MRVIPFAAWRNIAVYTATCQETVTRGGQTSIRSLGENVITSAKQENRRWILGINSCKLPPRPTIVRRESARRELDENGGKEEEEEEEARRATRRILDSIIQC